MAFPKVLPPLKKATVPPPDWPNSPPRTASRVPATLLLRRGVPTWVTPRRSLLPETRLNRSAAVAGANVFILFDTSNYMYRGFVFAQDAIADFVRSLHTADKV